MRFLNCVWFIANSEVSDGVLYLSRYLIKLFKVLSLKKYASFYAANDNPLTIHTVMAEAGYKEPLSFYWSHMKTKYPRCSEVNGLN